MNFNCSDILIRFESFISSLVPLILHFKDTVLYNGLIIIVPNPLSETSIIGERLSFTF